MPMKVCSKDTVVHGTAVSYAAPVVAPLQVVFVKVNTADKEEQISESTTLTSQALYLIE
jgi:hypothetical protein